MKEIIFENLIQENLTESELNDFFNQHPTQKLGVYEKQSQQLDVFDKVYYVSKKEKYTKVYKDKAENLKKVQRAKKNTIIKFSSETGEVEIAYYENGFLVPKVDLALPEDETKMKTLAMNYDNAYWEERETGRNFKLNKETEVIDFIKESASVAKLIKSVRQGDIRAKKNFYDYALNNNWEYFCTFTFKDETIRNDRNKIKEQWRYFVMKLQSISKDVKVLAVVEEHENGGYHLHALVSDIDLVLVPARNNNKNSKEYGYFLYTVIGDQIFNCHEWDKGFNTVVCIKPNSRQQKVVNYLTKYITKEPATLFGEKRFYRTRNYEVRSTEIMNCSEKEIQKLINENGLKMVKQDDYNKIKYYQIKLNTKVPKNISDNITKVIQNKHSQRKRSILRCEINGLFLLINAIIFKYSLLLNLLMLW